MADAARQAYLRRYAYLYAGPASRSYRRGIGLQNRLTDMMPDTDGEIGATTTVPQVPLDVAEIHNNAMGTQTDRIPTRDASTGVRPRPRAMQDGATQADDVRIDHLRAINHRFEEEEARAERAERRAPTRNAGTDPAEEEPGPSGAPHDQGTQTHFDAEHVTHMGDNYYAPVQLHIQIQEAQRDAAHDYAVAAAGYINAQTRTDPLGLPDDVQEFLDAQARPVPQYPDVFADDVAAAMEHHRVANTIAGERRLAGQYWREYHVAMHDVRRRAGDHRRSPQVLPDATAARRGRQSVADGLRRSARIARMQEARDRRSGPAGNTRSQHR